MDFFHMVNEYSVPAVLIPTLIFFARICDVSLGTLRIMVVGRGMRVYASLLGFMEVFIWLGILRWICCRHVRWNDHRAQTCVRYRHDPHHCSWGGDGSCQPPCRERPQGHASRSERRENSRRDHFLRRKTEITGRRGENHQGI